MANWLEYLGHWLYPSDSEFPSLLPLTIFLCILFFLEALYLFIRNLSNNSEKRIKERLKFVDGLESKASGVSLIKSEMLPQDSWKKALLLKLNRVFDLDELLLQAAVPWSTNSFFLACVLMGSVAGGYGFFQFGPPGAVGGFLLVGYFLPHSLLVLKKRHRLKKFEKQLPEALGLMARSLKAGHSLPSSIQLVADEMANPIGIEFFKTFKEYNYGMDFNEVMLNLYKRNQLRDLKFFITAIMIQRETGGNLVEILDKIAHLIRERFKLVNQIKALTAEGRLSGLILIGLPIAIGLILQHLNPQYIGLLWTHPTGRKMAGVAIFFQVLGMLAIKKIVSIKV
jgi:tight adherence protein B